MQRRHDRLGNRDGRRDRIAVDTQLAVVFLRLLEPLGPCTRKAFVVEDDDGVGRIPRK